MAWRAQAQPPTLTSPVSSRFHEILKTLTESDEGKLHILKVVYDVWRSHPQVKAPPSSPPPWPRPPSLPQVTPALLLPQMISVLVDKMIRTQITDCAAVANWLFSQDMAHEFTRWDVHLLLTLV